MFLQLFSSSNFPNFCLQLFKLSRLKAPHLICISFQCTTAQCVTCLFSLSNFGHQVALLALVVHLANSWRFLHCHNTWDCPIDIISCYPHQPDSYQLSLHQVVPLPLVSVLTTRWRHLHCHIAWVCPIDIISWY